MSDEAKTDSDPNEEHDREAAAGEDHVPAKLTEAGNKAPPAEVPYKITHSG